MRPCQARPEEPRAVRGAQPDAGSVFRRRPFAFFRQEAQEDVSGLEKAAGRFGVGPRNRTCKIV